MTPEPLSAAAGAAGSPVAVGSVLLGLGDSIAAGIGAPHVSEGCLAVLARRLAERRPGLRLVNLAVPGESSTSMLAPGGQLEAAERVIARTGGEGAVAPVVLSIGGNDAMEAAVVGEEKALTALARNLDAILRRLDAALRAVGAGLAGSACLQTVYNPFELMGDVGTPALPPVDADALAPRRSLRGGHNRIIRTAAARWGIDVADVAHAFRGRTHELTWVRSGDIHPSARGHEVIADAYVAACGWEGV